MKLLLAKKLLIIVNLLLRKDLKIFTNLKVKFEKENTYIY